MPPSVMQSASHRGARLDIDLALQALEELQRDLERSRRAASQIQATHDGANSAVIARIGAVRPTPAAARR